MNAQKNPVAIQWLGLDPYEDLVVKMMAWSHEIQVD